MRKLLKIFVITLALIFGLSSNFVHAYISEDEPDYYLQENEMEDYINDTDEEDVRLDYDYDVDYVSEEESNAELEQQVIRINEEDSNIIRAMFTSPATGDLFIGYFDSQTGIASFHNMNDEFLFYRMLESEEDFWELVAINAEATSHHQSPEQHTRIDNVDRANRNVSRIDVETRTLIEYDEHGNRTETFLGDELMERFPNSRAFQEVDIAPFFDLRVRRTVFAASHPRHGNSMGGFFNTRSVDRFLDLLTFSFPSGMRTVDVMFVNEIGDDSSVHFDVRPNQEVWHRIRFAGEPYTALVSSLDGRFENVEFRLFTDSPTQNVTVTLNPQGGSVSPSSIVRMAGVPYRSGGALPTPSRTGGRRFIDWFDSSSLFWGTRIRDGSIVPHNNHTLHARWTDPDRHNPMWWPPDSSYRTEIRFRYINNATVNWNTWHSAMERGRLNWNNSGVNVRIDVNNSAISTVTVAPNGLELYGIVTVTSEPAFFMTLNSRLIPMANVPLDTMITRVMAHELGHVLGLADNPFPPRDDSIMNTGARFHHTTRPSSFDLDSAVMIYGELGF